MDSFTLNTTAAYHFRIFEVNWIVSFSSGIKGLLLHPRQQGHPYSIDMIERSTSEHFDWFLTVKMDSFTLNTTAAYHFFILDRNGPVTCSSTIQGLLLHSRKQGHPGWIDMVERYHQLTLWTICTIKISATPAMTMAMAIIIRSIIKWKLVVVLNVA